METSNLKSEQNSDLYTIPSFSSWFSWSNIHEIEKISLREFFDGSSITRSPRIYKEYRDFIISKFREDPSRLRLTFTEVRKSLVGDVSSLNKVFTFLEKWGLINFTGKASLSSASVSGDDVSTEKESKWTVRVEEGPPHGVRVVAAPNSLKPVMPPPPPVEIGGGAEVAEIGTKFPPLASYSNLFEEVMIQEQGKKCGNCKESCDSGYYELIKDQGYALCKKCFDNASYGEDKSIVDFKFVDHKSQEVVWTQAETLLLLESVLKHGDDWELVAENVKTKTKLDCIHKLLQLPFGDFLLGSSFVKNRVSDANANVSSVRELQISSSESQEIVTIQDNDKNMDKEMEIAGHDNKHKDTEMEIVGHDDKHKDTEIEIAGRENKNENEIMENDGHDDKNQDDKMETTGHDDKNQDDKIDTTGHDDKNQDDKMETTGHENKNQDDKMETTGPDDKKQDGKMENAAHVDNNQDGNTEIAEELGPPHKRWCTVPVSDASSSLMNQINSADVDSSNHVSGFTRSNKMEGVAKNSMAALHKVARLSSVVGPHVTASAAEAAVAELCYENRCTREIFDDDSVAEETGASPLTNKQKIVAEVESADGLKDSMVQELQDTTVQRNVVSLTLRMRAATATALGAAAANAKLLANQEEREIEHLVSTIMETQLKKLQTKAKHLEYLKLILEKQHNQSEEFKESLVAERLNVLQEIFSGGISRSKDLPTMQPQSSSSAV